MKFDRSCWFTTAAVFVVVLAMGRFALGFSPIEAYFFALASAALLLCINLVHEMGHVVVGSAFALKPKEVVILGWGAKTTYAGGAHNPRDLAIISLAGPGGNLAVAVVVGATIPFLGQQGLVLPSIAPPMREGLGLVAVVYCLINLAYAGLNLTPFYPRDGGRAFHALLWHLLNDRSRAETVCRQAGIALLLCAVVFFAARGEPMACAFILVLGGETLIHDLGAVLRSKLRSS